MINRIGRSLDFQYRLIFPEEVFDPARRLASDRPLRCPRNCIGKNLAYPETRLILARLFWHSDLETDGELPVQDGQKSFVVWDQGPFNIKMKIRDGRNGSSEQ